MQEGLQNIKRIRNGEITGKDNILRVQTKYRNDIASAFPAAYRYLINQGTNNPEAYAMTLQNFATKNALDLQSLPDYEIHNLVLGACPSLLSQTFPRYIAHEITGEGGHDISLVDSGLMNQQDVVSFAFDALSAADEGKDRDTHHKEKMNDFCRAVGKGFNRFNAASINFINIMLSGELCYSIHGVPLLLLLGTPKAKQYIFDSESIGTDGCLTNRLNIVGQELPHSQQWWDDFIKSNYTDEEKAQMCAKLWRFYLPLLQKLDIGTNESITNVRTQLAFNWGKKTNEEEIKAKKESRREMNQRKRDAWAAVKAGTSNDTQDKYVKRTGFYKIKQAWEMWHEDPSALLQNLDLLVVLVKGNSWKAHKESLLVCIDKDSRSRVALIPTLEAAANAEMKRRKAEQELIEAERKKKRLESINKELESIGKIPVNDRTAMHTIRLNLLNATLNENRREQVRWRDEQRKEKKNLEAAKKVLQRKELQELQSQTPSRDQEYAHQFRINLLTAQLQGRKEEVLSKKKACSPTCPECMRDDCGKCKACLDKIKFGGQNKLKQKCIERRCTNLGSGGGKMSAKKRQEHEKQSEEEKALFSSPTEPSTSQPRKKQKSNASQRVPKVDQNSTNQGRWNSEERKRFVSAYKMYGKDWKKVAAVVKTRTVIQIRRHAEKILLKLQKEASDSTRRQLEEVSFPFQVQMPAGVVEGQEVQVPHPQSGHMLVFAIPAGMKPGTIFNVSRESILRVHMK